MLTLMLNCGMRVSELVGIDLTDIRDNTLRLLGKGNKERVVYLNDACLAALENYLKFRKPPETGCPLRKYVPDVGVSRQPIIFISVDFPLPEWPTMATNSPL